MNGKIKQMIEQTEHIERIRKSLNGQPLKLTPPTANAALQITAFFEKDSDVFSIFDYDASLLTIFVKGAKKAEAINYLIKHKIELGAQTVIVKVIEVLENGKQEELPTPTYTITAEGIVSYLKDMFYGSKMKAEFSSFYDEIMEKTYHFCELDPEAVKVKNDTLSHPYGYQCFFPADIFKEYFTVCPYVFISTFARN